MRPRARRVLLGLAALAAVGIALAWTLRAELALAVAARAAHLTLLDPRGAARGFHGR